VIVDAATRPEDVARLRQHGVHVIVAGSNGAAGDS